MKIRRCDRCSKIVEDKYEGVEMIVSYGNNEGKRIYDICDECYAEFFDDFMVAESSEQVQK